MSNTFIVTIIIICFVCVTLAFCCICLKKLFESIDKTEKMEKRIRNIERNVGSINKAVSTMPERIEESTRAKVDEIARMKQEPVFKAPPVEPQTAPASDIQNISETENDEIRNQEVRIQETKGQETDNHDGKSNLNEGMRDVQANKFGSLLNEINDSQIQRMREAVKLDSADYEELLSELKKFDEMETVTDDKPESGNGNSNHKGLMQSNSEAVNNGIDEIDEITLDDILMKISEENLKKNLKEENLKQEKRATAKLSHEYDFKTPNRKESHQEEVLKDVFDFAEPEETVKRSINEEDIRTKENIRAKNIDYYIVQDEDNVSLPKHDSEENMYPEDLVQDSALDIYFSNEKATPRRQSMKTEIPVSEEEFDVGRSGRKYTVSELESLIRD